MHVLVVSALPEGFHRNVITTAVRALTETGHDVRAHDLIAEGFRPAMSALELARYESGESMGDPLVAMHAEDVQWAEAMVFVYASRWTGLPAVLKGWLERVLVPGVAFRLDEATRRVRPALGHVRVLVGITAGPYRTLPLRDAGRRTITRALWLVCSPRPRRVWLALRGADAASPHEWAAFCDRVDRRLRRL